ncbi:MAG: glycosyltransferase family 1 protein [Pontixanthobacter sp.]
MMQPPAPQPSDLRIALFSGNYNMTLDGANKALNRLVEYLLRQGAKVRVYSPTVDAPAFEPEGDLVSLPSFAIPGRSEYRMPIGLSAAVKRDLAAFAPNILHIASPDFSARAAVSWAKTRGLPVLASVHTRFETYPRYYSMAFLEPVLESWIRGLYKRCDALVTPSQSMVDVLREQDMNDDISIWSRGVDRDVFASQRRDPQWRRKAGIADDEICIVFLGRLVMEKGLNTFARTIAKLRERGLPHKVLVIGDGPARKWFAQTLPDAVFAGFQTGTDLGRTLASGDIFFNPSITETFGNVTLEAMASGLPVIASAATGSRSLVKDGVTGTLVHDGKPASFADAIGPYLTDAALREAHGAAGEERAKDYSWDAINAVVADTYIRLIGEHGR